MTAQWIIEKKRDGGCLSGEEISLFVRGYVKGDIPDYQMAALLMAVAIRGMTLGETVSLTRTMLESGLVLDLTPVRRPKIDKHSTGGVGDKISLVLAPLVAACGAAAPMIVGRGLGITGGTLDKLEAIPGCRGRLGAAEFRRVVHKCGCAIAGASERIAPADRKIYALRDASGTVESIPLIVASILSKKLAAGLDGIVFDVKCGRGAFMKTRRAAEKLAETLVSVSGRFRLRAGAVITDMNQPLGRAVGNALEVIEAVETLRGRGPADVLELTLALGVKMLRMAGLASSAGAARRTLAEKINSGEAFERFKLMVRLQGGDAALLDRPGKLARAGVKCPVKAVKSGYVQKADAELIGKASVMLGAGRRRLEELIDHSAGLMVLKKIGDYAERGEPLAWLYASSAGRLAAARELAAAAFRTGTKRIKPPKLVMAEL
ncbi:MAG: thymidine phosphorylase [Kiritimatiellae bacterium]|nr:thymidine phosphorylase [Kiritimatiellia bacterium]